MNKEIQDKAWVALPKEFKEEVKEKYNAYKGSIYEDIYIDTFGIHNLIETKFKVGDKVVCLNFPCVWREITDIMNDGTYVLDNSIYDVKDSDIESYNEETKTKYRKGDIVIYKHNGKIKIIQRIEDNDRYLITTLNGQSPLWVDESLIEPFIK